MQQIGDALVADPGEVRLVADSVELLAYQRAALLECPMPDAQKRIKAAKARVIRAISQCDSPIERRLMPALVFANYGHMFASFPADLHCPKIDQAPPKGDLIVIPQFAYVRFRLDFAIIAKADDRRLIVGVECDGEEFHKDADKDRERDAYLKAFDVTMFRFSGRQIQADPLPLASRVAMHVADWRASL